MSAASTPAPVANATVGKNVTFKGQIISREDLIIQGEVEGTIEIGEHRLTIASNGKVLADVIAREVEVIGSMYGKIKALEKVYVRNGASIIGDTYAASIIIEEGAYIKGGIDLSSPRADHEPTWSNADSEIRELSDAVLTS